MKYVTYKFNVKQYHLMSEVGVFKAGYRSELINGQVVEMSPITTFHTACVERLNKAFSELLIDLAIVSVQNRVILSNLSETQPDIALLKPGTDFYPAENPVTSDIFLLVEVADTGIEYDINFKIPLYATHGVPEVWLVNIVEQVVVVYSQPETDGYREVNIYQRGENLCLTPFPTINLPVNQILGG